MEIPDNTIQDESIWGKNPQLKNLLLFFIFTFIVCGITLIVYAQVENYYGQQTYLATEATMPWHKVPKPASKQATTTPVSIDTAGWQTYTNSTYGFEFFYPKDWMFVGEFVASSSSPVLLNFASPSSQQGPHFKDYGGDLNIWIYPNNGRMTLTNFIVTTFPVSDASGGSLKIKVGGKNSMRFYGVGGETTSEIAIIDDVNQFLEISDASRPPILDQILPTFIFIK